MCDDDVAALVVDNGAFTFCEINNCDNEKKKTFMDYKILFFSAN